MRCCMSPKLLSWRQIRRITIGIVVSITACGLVLWMGRHNKDWRLCPRRPLMIVTLILPWELSITNSRFPRIVFLHSIPASMSRHPSLQGLLQVKRVAHSRRKPRLLSRFHHRVQSITPIPSTFFLTRLTLYLHPLIQVYSPLVAGARL